MGGVSVSVLIGVAVNVYGWEVVCRCGCVCPGASVDWWVLLQVPASSLHIFGPAQCHFFTLDSAPTQLAFAFGGIRSVPHS